MAAACSFEPVAGKSVPVPFADPVVELLAAGTSVELLVADMAAACSFEPVAGKSVPVPFADPVVELLAAGTSVELLVADLLEQAVVPSS